jgi:DNA polymerase-3 subunit gamma/tau
VTYTVLAVKWRPKRFDELVGQAHVVQALVNSLAQGRLHHAYLFSGTRGVGKTTIARILAKALNCAQGVVPEPCGGCQACLAIDEGRFVDLIEVDAASRTRVDDTRELLDNVQYAPTQGRYKVYLIDEVHMLSNHSFNALLKTLEEPPPHVKFLLATTDPQKLPITVLSRCLQFNLKKLSTAQIQEQLEKICSAEQTAADAEGLRAIAKSAYGSMRDALSLLDQGIAFGGGSIEGTKINAMLGSIDRDHVLRFLAALAEQDGVALVAEVERLDELAPDYGAVLDDLMGALQQIAVIQLIDGKAIDESHEALVPFAAAMTREDVQLYYQIALHGRRDLAYCRDTRMGFEMSLLRMLAFRPADAETSGPEGGSRDRPAKEARAASSAGQRAGIVSPDATGDRTAVTADGGATTGHSASGHIEASSPNGPAADEASADAIGDWGGVLAAAGVRGPARQLGDHCCVERANDKAIDLVLRERHKHLNTEQVRSRLQRTISEYFGSPRRISIRLGEPAGPTPAENRAANENDRMRVARESIESDPVVKAVQSVFGGVVEADTVQPTDDEQRGIS